MPARKSDAVSDEPISGDTQADGTLLSDSAGKASDAGDLGSPALASDESRLDKSATLGASTVLARKTGRAVGTTLTLKDGQAFAGSKMELSAEDFEILKSRGLVEAV